MRDMLRTKGEQWPCRVVLCRACRLGGGGGGGRPRGCATEAVVHWVRRHLLFVVAGHIRGGKKRKERGQLAQVFPSLFRSFFELCVVASRFI